MGILVSLALRVVVPAIIAVSLWAWGYTSGISRESDRRDAQELKIREKADKDYEVAATAATNHALASLEWKRKAENYYRKWQEKLNDVEDRRLSECIPPVADEAPARCVLSSDWVGLYNDAWFRNDTPANTAGTDAVPGGASAATPREVLLNVRENAQLCAEDRKRQRELINLLHDLEAARAGTNN